jgi:hypothetical protein
LCFEFPFLSREFDAIEELRDFLHPILIANEDDVMSDVLWFEIKMVNASVWIEYEF